MSVAEPRAQKDWVEGAVQKSEVGLRLLVTGTLLSIGIILLGLLGPIMLDPDGESLGSRLAGLALALFGIVTAWTVLQRRGAVRPIPGFFRVVDGGLFCDDELCVQSADVASLSIHPQGDHVLVELALKTKAPISISLPNAAETERLLHMLALGSTIRKTVLSALSPLRSFAPWQRAGLTAVMAIVPIVVAGRLNLQGESEAAFGAVFGGLAITIVLFVLLFHSRTAVRVGRDGVISRWLGIERYHPFSRVSSVERRVVMGLSTVELRMSDGRSVLFAQSSAREAELFRGAIDEMRKASSERVESAPDLTSLRRPGASLTEWVRALRALGNGANADHRTASVEPDALLRIVEDPSSPGATRVAAALALASRGSTAHLGRAKIARGAIASEKLRIALEWASDPATPDDELSQILAEIEADDALQSRAR